MEFRPFSIQEFLAAYYIANLPVDEQLLVLEEKFWKSVLFSNTFSLYTSYTNGQQLSFKQFLSGGNNNTLLVDAFLDDALKCVLLHRRFSEADDKAICTSILNSSLFHIKVLNLSKIRLSPYAFSVECVALFLTSSPDKT